MELRKITCINKINISFEACRQQVYNSILSLSAKHNITSIQDVVCLFFLYNSVSAKMVKDTKKVLKTGIKKRSWRNFYLKLLE